MTTSFLRKAFVPGVLALAGAAVAGSRPPRLEWADPLGRRPGTHAEWVARRGAEQDRFGVGTVARLGDGNVVAVVVQAELYPLVATEAGRYASDLVAGGWAVQLDTMRGGSAVALRTHLAGVADICGAVLVGELPVAWYEDGWGRPTGEEFPIELFFADLDGNWVDADGDGLYDGHTGAVAPDIWVGRLYARPLTWDSEARLVRRYFDKNHAFRTGNLALPDRALSYVDDDWQGFGDCSLGETYADVTTVTNPGTTTAPDYRGRLDDGFEWIHVCAHSSPWGHTFRANSSYSGTVFNCEMYAIRPRAHFYNLFACSGTRFTEENCSAGWDIFQEDYGLAAVGSAKTGSMLEFGDFYRPLGQGECIGEAFRQWFTLWGEDDRDWFYGMNVLGDPTLRPHGNAVGAPGPPAPEPRMPIDAEVVGTHPETDDSPALLALANGDLWALWKSGRSTSNGRFDIYASVRRAGNWSSPYSVGAHQYWDTDPALGVDGQGRVVAVWANFTEDYHFNLFYSLWNGSSWSARQQVSEDCASDIMPVMCRDSSGTLWLFWTSRRDVAADVFASSWNGSSWSQPSNLTADSTSEYHPAAATAADGTVWLVYTRHRGGVSEVWARYRDNGNWVETGPVSGIQRAALRPAISCDGESAPVVCWQSFDSGDGEICWSRREGTSWTAPAAVGADPGLDVHPAMATDTAGIPRVVWMSDRTGDWDIHCSEFRPGGWLPAETVEPGPGPGLNPAVAAAADGQVWVCWQQLGDGNWDIYAATLPQTGVAERPGAEPARLEAGPSPFSRVCRVAGAAGARSLEIVDAAGRVVRRLAVAGGRAEWDGCDEQGRELPAGVYLARAGATRPARLVLAR